MQGIHAQAQGLERIRRLRRIGRCPNPRFIALRFSKESDRFVLHKEKSDATRHHSPCLTPYTALESLLSVALSSVTAKSNYTIPLGDAVVNVQPCRRRCSVSATALFNLSDEGVQLQRPRCSLRALYTICSFSPIMHTFSGDLCKMFTNRLGHILNC